VRLFKFGVTTEENKMVNGLHLYSAFTDPMATKELYICLTFASHSPIHSLIHTPMAVSAMQGTIQLIR